MHVKILLIEGKGAGTQSFAANLRRKGYEVEAVLTGKAAIESLDRHHPVLAIVDAASLRSSGKRICADLRLQSATLPILVIENADHRFTDTEIVNVVLQLPFTVRKLINRIKPLIPNDQNKLLHAGPISLDIERRIVNCDGREVQLTPRLSGLLEIFLRQPGIVLEREVLFRHVWSTEYTGDTRTLDVHISWLRRAIEENPRKPRYLRTIRGIGYRLDIT